MSNTIEYNASDHNVDSVSVFFQSDQAEVSVISFIHYVFTKYRLPYR